MKKHLKTFSKIINAALLSVFAGVFGVSDSVKSVPDVKGVVRDSAGGTIIISNRREDSPTTHNAVVPTLEQVAGIQISSVTGTAYAVGVVPVAVPGEIVVLSPHVLSNQENSLPRIPLE